MSENPPAPFAKAQPRWQRGPYSFTEIESRAGVAPWLPSSRALQRLRAGSGTAFDLEFDAPKGFPPLRGALFAGGERFDLGWTRGARRPDPGWHTQLAANLRDLADAAVGAGASLIVLTYPAPAVGYVSDVIRAAARERGVPLADVAQTLQPLCPAGACPDLYVDQQHLTRAGHEIVARSLLSKLRADPKIQRSSG